MRLGEAEMASYSVVYFSPILARPSVFDPLSGGRLAEWSAHQARDPAALGSSLALATCWICSRLSLVQILGYPYTCK